MTPFAARPFATGPFPWSEAIGFGLGVLRLAPDAFWRMTPRELAHAIRAVRGPAAGGYLALHLQTTDKRACQPCSRSERSWLSWMY